MIHMFSGYTVFHLNNFTALLSSLDQHNRLSYLLLLYVCSAFSLYRLVTSITPRLFLPPHFRLIRFIYYFCSSCVLSSRLFHCYAFTFYCFLALQFHFHYHFICVLSPRRFLIYFVLGFVSVRKNLRITVPFLLP